MRAFHFYVALAAALGMTACAENSGTVELDWNFVDGDFRALYPSSGRRSSCELSAPRETGGPEVQYALRTRLSVYACSEGQLVEDCLAVEPIAQERFSCERARGIIEDLPALDDPYLFTVDVELDPQDAEPFIPSQDCIARAGPRIRKIRAGQIINLAVYQFVVHIAGSHAIPLSACTEESSASSDAREHGRFFSHLAPKP